eukprot:Platyproteum_vivax@DN15578_c0_g1_i1.p1
MIQNLSEDVCANIMLFLAAVDIAECCVASKTFHHSYAAFEKYIQQEPRFEDLRVVCGLFMRSLIEYNIHRRIRSLQLLEEGVVARKPFKRKLLVFDLPDKTVLWTTDTRNDEKSLAHVGLSLPQCYVIDIAEEDGIW